MACRSCLRRFRALTLATLVTLGMGLTIDCAGAGGCEAAQAVKAPKAQFPAPP